MSEYQYYEFLAVDRPLDDRQLDELRALSTRATITRTSFINEYHWGAFRGDPRTMMERYFEAFLYLANWGTHEVMIRLPAGLLTFDVAQRYCVGDAVTAWQSGGHVIVSLSSEDEDGDWEHGGEGWLSSIAPVRADLAAGDVRALYLAWLLSAQTELDEDDVEPPVPAGLSTLTESQRSLAEFLRIDGDLLDVAAAASRPVAQPLASSSSDAELTHWVDGLSNAEKNVLLRRVLRGDAHVQAELRRRFGQRSGQPVTGVSGEQAHVPDPARPHEAALGQPVGLMMNRLHAHAEESGQIGQAVLGVRMQVELSQQAALGLRPQ